MDGNQAYQRRGATMEYMGRQRASSQSVREGHRCKGGGPRRGELTAYTWRDLRKAGGALLDRA